MAVTRFNADGSKDSAFGVDGVVTLDLSTGVVNGTAFSADSAWGLAITPDDRLVISGGQVRPGGKDTDFALVRLNADGTREARSPPTVFSRWTRRLTVSATTQALAT